MVEDALRQCFKYLCALWKIKFFLKKIRKWVSYNGETHSKLLLICISLRLDSAEKYCVCVSSFLILSFFFFLRRAFHVHCGSHTGRESKIMFFQWVSCTIHGTHKYFIKKKYFKTESYSTIYIFKNYFQFLAK